MVEAALALPLTVLFVLGLFQLALVSHARIATEYAAYQAARAGVVWNANVPRMQDAALVSLTPTFGPAQDARTMSSTHLRLREEQDRWRMALAGNRQRRNGFDPEGLVRVDLIEPTTQALDAAAGQEALELDFDLPGGRDQPGAIERWLQATVLRVELRYFFELRVPFAGWAIFRAWQAAQRLRGQAEGVSLTDRELKRLSALADGEAREGGRARFYLPLFATASSRLQSNVYRKWLEAPP